MTDDRTPQSQPAEPAEITDESLEAVSGGLAGCPTWPFIRVPNPLEPPILTTFPVPDKPVLER